MIDHSQLSLMITNQEYEERTAFSTVKKIYIDQPDPWQSMPVSRLPIKLSLQNTCHVIYTSGSTGQPKGVQICQQSMINFLSAMLKKPGIDSSDVLCSITTLSFDISVLELYLPLICGGKVVIVGREISMYGDLLFRELRENKVTYMQATPASWRLLLQAGWRPPPGFKILCGGEPFPKDLAMSLLKHCPEVWNMYGPTETTVWSTAHKVRADEKIIRIGRPIDNTSIYILDQQRQLVAQGVSGKLYIGGKGLALGYLNRPDLTAERFVANPFIKGELIYDTGDMARYHANGELECLGRDDGQVKVRGYRIELGEIESVLASFSGVQQQVVIVREDQPGDAKLVAYYIADQELNITKLRNHLLGVLPIYMIPAHFVWMKRFPMTLNEKIDRKNLPVPELVSLEDSRPVTAAEQQMNATELCLYQIWSKLFNRCDFRITDNFFDLGGYSLLSVEMFGFVEKEYNLNLPISTLFAHGSIKTLAALIDQKINLNKITRVTQVLHKKQLHSLTLMRPGTTGDPVFFFHGVGGNVLNYRALFSAIPPERPVYGLQSAGIDGQSTLTADFSGMIQQYCSEIRTLYPKEEYLFIGGSMGGIIALEAARCMRKHGGAIDKIIMLDTFGPSFSPLRYSEKKQKFTVRLFGFLTSYARKISMSFRASFYRLLHRPLSHEIRYYFVEKNNHKLIREHRLKPINEDVILIRGIQTESGQQADPLLGWKRTIQGELKIFTTKADHTTIVEDEQTREILKNILS
jgi:amino acid adenylation domain-containing protein